MKQAVIFDMDGVLVESEPETLKQRDGYFASLGIKINQATQTAMLGGNLADIWPTILPGRTESEYARLQTGYVAYKHAHPFNYGEIMLPDVRSTFVWLHEHGYQVAIASASDHDFIDQMLDQTKLRPYVDVVTSGTDFTASKPDPAVYLAALSALHLPASDAVAVEDSTIGIQAAKAAGLYTFAVPIRDTRFTADQSAADARITTVAGVCSYLNRPAEA
ncbi:HAD family hydrolase [Lacticaseibacillus brantae]|uniref:HAD family phosphatase n=1 Tax=Lacticaseibacillus brantae DSM 23927 TaxID=1423727 RepID=A0A0R2B940_9LACO|nr:HAD family phosphatase [Lacticaseibacillus brantae]KRM72921.1 hypothetical protein FC34_GL000633 [Lacticaseibacillus brantae DSM 23927]